MADAESGGLIALERGGGEDAVRLQAVAHARRWMLGWKRARGHGRRSTPKRWALRPESQRGHALPRHLRQSRVSLQHGLEALLVNRAKGLGNLHDAMYGRRPGRLRPGFRHFTPDLGKVPIRARQTRGRVRPAPALADDGERQTG